VTFSLAVTHLDETGGKIIDAVNNRLPVYNLLCELGLSKIAYTSYGITRETIKSPQYD